MKSQRQHDRKRLGEDAFQRRQQQYRETRARGKNGRASVADIKPPLDDTMRFHMSQCPMCREHCVNIYLRDGKWGCCACQDIP